MLFNVSEEDKNKSGVYKIYNKLNDRTYYGSTKDFKKRFANHLELLNHDRHYNNFLQNDFNKCKNDTFVFSIVELTILEERLDWEQMYIDEYWDNQKFCYNFLKKVRPERSCFSYNPEETSKRISDAAKRSWNNDITGERRKKQSDRSKSKEYLNLFYKNCHSSEAHEKIGMSKAKTYLLIDPLGDIVTISNLEKFCRENNLDRRNMGNVNNGRFASSNGWRKYDPSLVGIPYVSNKKHKQKTFKIKSPSGEIFEATNIKEFSEKHNLIKENLAAVIRGIRNSHRGWTRVD